jgi:OmpR-family two-component system manganese-sensing sensor histidine kinase
MFQATRRRLALWYTAVTAFLLLLFATGIYLYFRITLIERIDDTLKHIIEVVNRSSIVQPIALSEGHYQVNLEDSFHRNAEAVEDDHIDLEWFNPQGQLLWSTFDEPIAVPLNPNRNGETVRLSDSHLLRQVTERLEVRQQVLGYLRASHPWFEVTKPSRQLAIDLSLGISLMLLAVASIGWFLSGIAIQPVKDSYQSLKQFTADASHELRNPIATIQANIQTALAYPNADAQWQQRQLQVVERLTQRLGNLVNDLLFLARSDSGIVQPDWQPVPLDALLMEVMEEQRIVAEKKGVFLSLHIAEPEDEPRSGEPFTLQGDWHQLARLFTNLIGNALEYGFPAGETAKEAAVTVQLQRLKREPRQAYLQVQVKDAGAGIPAAALPHLFDRFYRPDPARHHEGDRLTSSGSGLGLAIARAIVENHRGQIGVESILNQGTIFTVTLPLVGY